MVASPTAPASAWSGLGCAVLPPCPRGPGDPLQGGTGQGRRHPGGPCHLRQPPVSLPPDVTSMGLPLSALPPCPGSSGGWWPVSSRQDAEGPALSQCPVPGQGPRGAGPRKPGWQKGSAPCVVRAGLQTRALLLPNRFKRKGQTAGGSRPRPEAAEVCPLAPGKARLNRGGGDAQGSLHTWPLPGRAAGPQGASA